MNQITNFKIMRSLLLLIMTMLLVEMKATAQATYWQQQIDYTIDVTLNDTLHQLSGNVKITYHNNSPNTLTELYLHLYPNAYQNLNTPFAKQQIENKNLDFYKSNEAQRGYINELAILVDNQKSEIESINNHIDYVKIKLAKPLAAGGVAIIETPFRVKIPESYSRMGHEDNAYQITQWYPAIAAYDKTGWHPMSYLDQGEFYADFGCYDVRITLPDNYIVAATGELQTQTEKEFIALKIEQTKSKEILLATQEKSPLPSPAPESSKRLKTLHYTQCDIHDFAWFANKQFDVEKSKVTTQNGKTIDTYVFYPPTKHSDLWEKKAVQYVDSAVYFYSLWLGDYKYNTCTAVLGGLKAGGGMEYPMITVIAEMNTNNSLENVIVHEVGHNWFQGMLASNERMFPWLDEGLNSYYETRYMSNHAQHKSKGTSIKIPFMNFDEVKKDPLFLNKIANKYEEREHIHQAIGLPSEAFTGTNYGTMVYMKTPLIWNYVVAYLGTEVHDQLMKKYFNEWALKHPYPGDLKAVFATSGKELEWLFEDAINTTKSIDYSIHKINKEPEMVVNQKNYTVTIINKGQIKAPFTISGIKNGNVIETQWYNGFGGEMEVLFPYYDYDRLEIDVVKIIPELDRNNNHYNLKSPIHKCDLPNIKLITSLEVENRKTLNLLPAVAWNENDKLQVGLIMHNTTLPYNAKWDVQMAPLYSATRNLLTGVAKVEHHHFFDSKKIEKLSIGLTAQQFSLNQQLDKKFVYNSLHPTIKLAFKNKSMRDNIVKTLRASAHIINRTVGKNYVFDTTNFELLQLDSRSEGYTTVELRYETLNNRKLNPYKYCVSAELINQIVRLQAEGTYKIHYQRSSLKGIKARVFAGVFANNSLQNSYKNSANSDFTLSGSSAAFDYQYNELYLGRAQQNPIFTHQLINNNGGFKSYSSQTNAYRAGFAMATAHLKAEAPFKLPIGIFASAGIIKQPKGIQNNTDAVIYETGAYFSILNEAIEVYLPLAFSKQLGLDIRGSQNTILKRLTYVIDLKKMNPIKLARNLQRLL